MKKYLIKNEYQEITILNYGATIYKWLAFSDQRNIVVSNENLEDYLDSNNGFLSSTIGRYANRIKDGKFTLNNKEYHLEKNFPGNNHGHGGNNGFHTKKFKVILHEINKIVLKYLSKDLEEGYPGEVELTVTYQLNNQELLLTFEAISNKDTILNITNHAYFNLSDEENILNHFIKANINKVLETDNYLVPTGKIINTKNTVLDLRNEQSLKEIILSEEVLNKSNGLDHAFLFNEDKFIELKYQNKSLKITTSYPGTQIYTMQNELTQKLLKRKYQKYLAIAFEPQFEPDAINHQNFSNVILKKGDKYHHFIKYILSEN